MSQPASQVVHEMSPQMQEMSFLQRLSLFCLRRHDASDADRKLMSRWLAEKVPVRIVAIGAIYTATFVIILPILTWVLRNWLNSGTLWMWYGIYFLLFIFTYYILSLASAFILERTLVQGGWRIERGVDRSSAFQQ
jgi:hypothetical protein